jgi:transcription elongation factor Elf1
MTLSDLLKEKLPAKERPPGITVKNRFDVLRNVRDRSASAASSRCDSPGKRFRTDSPETSEPVDRNLAFTSMANEEEKFVKAKALIGKIKDGLANAKEQGMQGPLWEIVSSMAEWMEITTGVQEVTANVVVDSYNKVASPRKSRKDSPRRAASKVISDEEAAILAKKKKFVQEVKDAERSSLIFKTNMGPVPIMNPDTMRKRFSMDLADKAAAVEGAPEGRPTAEVAAQLDDALGMVTKMEYFGKETKKAKKKGKDAGDEDFYTIPVKLTFRDKETRDAADGRMRKLCKTGGTIPYHRTLRNVINKVIMDAKDKYKGSFIQVKVDAEKFRLRVSRREDGVWHNNIELIDLPDEVLDLSRMGPKVIPRRGEDKDEEMESEQSQG